MIRLLAITLFLAAALPRPAAAAVLDEFFARGYSVAASTVVAGGFTGCVRQHRLVFADGSIFACARTTAQTAYDPRVYILRQGSEAPSVVLVGSHVLAGQLMRLRRHDYPVPLRMNPDPLAAQPPVPTTVLQPISPIRSLDTLTQQQNAPLSEQQDRLPIPPPKNRSSR